MKRVFTNAPHFKWMLIMLLLLALMVAIIIYYNRRIKTIDDQLKRISLIPGPLKGELSAIAVKQAYIPQRP